MEVYFCLQNKALAVWSPVDGDEGVQQESGEKSPSQSTAAATAATMTGPAQAGIAAAHWMAQYWQNGMEVSEVE